MLPERADIVDPARARRYDDNMRAHAHRDNDTVGALRGSRSDHHGRHHLLSPKGVLRLQREAGNGAVAGALAVQRKKGEMFEFSEGTIEGLIDNKHTIISVTDGWLK